MVWGFSQWRSAANFPGTGRRCPCPTTCPANSTSFTKSQAFVGLHTMLCLSKTPNTRRKSF